MVANRKDLKEFLREIAIKNEDKNMKAGKSVNTLLDSLKVFTWWTGSVRQKCIVRIVLTDINVKHDIIL